MKKLILVALVVILFSCSDNNRAKNWGGKETVNLPKGERLVTATWKDDDLWYVTEPMPEGYTPNSKKFYQSSSWGIWEGQVTFVESK